MYQILGKVQLILKKCKIDYNDKDISGEHQEFLK